MLYLFSGTTNLGKCADCKAEAQRLANITSFKGSVRHYSTMKLINRGKEWQAVESFTIVSNGLTQREWRAAGMPTVDKVEQILKQVN